MNSFEITEGSLPAKFNNAIISNDQSAIVIRCSVKNMDDINEWVTSFGNNSHTQWNARSSIPLGEKIVCSKKFVCHHSAFMKIARDENKKGISKNAYCHASIHVIVKLNTKNTRKKDQFIKQGLQGVIKIKNNHTHSLMTADTLRFLQGSGEMKNTFFGYFADRMTMSEAIKFHEGLFEYKDNRELLLASGSTNPTYRTVQNWYNQWRTLNLGPRTGSGIIEKLQEKQALFREMGTTIIFSEDPFAVVIATAIMKRALDMEFSQEIVFIDSTSACDAEQHAVTFVMAPCAAGAVPLSIIITKGQTCEAYTKGFQLLQEVAENKFRPKIILTDNSAAEISALNTVFPFSSTLLCIFHVLQAVWRWLWNSKHGIPKEKRQILMKYFRDILYSNTEAEATKAFNKIDLKYENWSKYVQGYWGIKEKWCLAWRNEDSRGHHTNNFCEVSVRLFKDNILCRVKVYNVIALLDVISTVMEDFYKHKLRKFANSRSASTRLYLLSMMQKSLYLENKVIEQLNECEFKVPSEKSDEFYIVNTEAGFCSCIQGITGKFCKHQCGVYQCMDIKSKNFPSVSEEDRYFIAKLALGESAPPCSFYKPFLGGDHGQLKTEHTELTNISQTSVNVKNRIQEAKNLDCKTTYREENADVEINEICEIIKSHHTLMKSSKSGALKFKNRLLKIRTKGQWESFLHTAGNSCVPLKRKPNSSIRVQATSIARRPTGITRGSKRLPSGRPFKDEQKCKKRKRNLAQNIERNIPNATSHGFNH